MIIGAGATGLPAAVKAIDTGASAVVVELVFNLPGVGTLLINAVAGRDYPLVQGIVLMSGVFVVIVSAIGDVVTTRIDPRANL